MRQLTLAALTLLHSERPKLYGVLACLSVKGLTPYGINKFDVQKIKGKLVHARESNCTFS